MRLDSVERRSDADVHSAAAQKLGGVVTQAGGDLGEDLGGGIDEDPVLWLGLQRWVVAERVLNQVGKLRQRFHSRVAGPDEDEGQLPAAVALGVGGCGDLQPRQHVVPQTDRVAQRLEAERVLGEAGNRKSPDDRSQRDDQIGVPHPEQAILGLDLGALPLGVVRDDSTEDEIGVRAHHSQRDDDVPRLEGPRRGLRHHRGVEHVVLRAHDRGAAPPELAGDVGPGESAAGDQGSALCLQIHDPLLASPHVRFRRG